MSLSGLRPISSSGCHGGTSVIPDSPAGAVRVALVGAPNVGKSALFNRLTSARRPRRLRRRWAPRPPTASRSSDSALPRGWRTACCQVPRVGRRRRSLRPSACSRAAGSRCSSGTLRSCFAWAITLRGRCRPGIADPREKSCRRQTSDVQRQCHTHPGEALGGLSPEV
ncbi:MAG: 50S ribosome-binding GTPase [Gemmatimonadetes bacterium]|nr:50S ribosome-binding GTPase [Gemmatimonadota bacterium]